MDDNLYQLLRHIETPDVKLNTIFSDSRPLPISGDKLYEMMAASENIDYLAKMIIERADPLRNTVPTGKVEIVKDKIKQYLTSWKNLGKFDKFMGTHRNRPIELNSVNIVAQLDSYNLEFIEAFAETILPTSDTTKVKSVVNPSGMYAQQERIIKVNSKPVPFYERALYKRLNDFNMDLALDETEAPFYKMDKNPNLSDQERKKTNRSSEQPSHLDRQGMSFRMKPNYQKYKYA